MKINRGILQIKLLHFSSDAQQIRHGQAACNNALHNIFHMYLMHSIRNSVAMVTAYYGKKKQPRGGEIIVNGTIS